MDKKELCEICLLNEHCQHNFDYECQTAFNKQNKQMTKEEYHIAKEYFKLNKKLIQCEFFELCNHKEINGTTKYHCTDLKSLDDSYAYCIIRKNVLELLGNSDDLPIDLHDRDKILSEGLNHE